MQKPANAIMRKVGPLPVWAWAALALAAWFLFLRNPSPAAGSGLPYTPASSGSGAQQPSSGQGTPADNGNADLLAALQGNKSSYDALLAALQYGTAGSSGATGGAPAQPAGSSSGGGGGFDFGTAQVSAPTVDSGFNNAPVDSFAFPAQPYVDSYNPGTIFTTDTGQKVALQPSGVYQPAYIGPSGDYVSPLTYAGAGVDPQPVPGPDPVPDIQVSTAPNPFGVDTTPDALDRYLFNQGIDTAPAPFAVSQPTPTDVQPAPVDTGGVVDTRPARLAPGHAVAV